MNTPALDKLRSVCETSQAIGNFLDWLKEDGIILSRQHQHADHCYEDGDRVCGVGRNELVFDPEGIEKRLARYFDIDLDAVERERCQLLEDLRARHGSHSGISP